MFERRLRFLLGLLLTFALIIVLRLFDIQVVSAAYYRERAERSLVSRPEPLPFVRGSIRDREGRILVCDAPTWELQVDYSVIALEDKHLERHARYWLKRGRYRDRGAATLEQVKQCFREEREAMFRELASFESRLHPVTAEEIKERADDIHRRTALIRRLCGRAPRPSTPTWPRSGWPTVW